MATFIISMNWTEQAIKNIKQAPARAKYGRDLAQKYNVTYQQLYMTSGDSDLIAIVTADHGDNVAQFALALASHGNVRTRTCRAWPEDDYLGLISAITPLP